MKIRFDALVIVENMLKVQNMKTGPDALGTTENESKSVKHEN
jgi:hypothetical protein